MMTPQKKIKSLVYLVVFLLATNVIMLVFILLTWDNRQVTNTKNENLVGSFLQKQIGFNGRQMATYQSLRKKDFEKGRPVFEEMRAAKDSFYQKLYKKDVADSELNELTNIIGEKQKAVDRHMFQHFKNVRNLCRPEQLPKFDSLFNEVVKKITAGRSRKHDNDHH